MSDGMSDARRDVARSARVYSTAHALRLALSDTGDVMFYRVHPRAIEIVNEELSKLGLEIVRKSI